LAARWRLFGWSENELSVVAARENNCSFIIELAAKRENVGGVRKEGFRGYFQ
jgi:hypothetical protein